MRRVTGSDTARAFLERIAGDPCYRRETARVLYASGNERGPTVRKTVSPRDSRSGSYGDPRPMFDVRIEGQTSHETV
jgi:hypothetical protein